ncbi:MAG TPA: haloacid dehalogenase type II [Candidatus Binatia bacterium]|jgi:2-haloacid dehalogenase|nr:haloacid dehalogenase type II [Candidatus Binatia bacterium]
MPVNQSWVEQIKACVFDAYGTVFDVHSAVGQYRARVGDRADQVSSVWRTKQLEYTWLRSLMGKHADFWQVTQEALDCAFATYGLTDPGLHRALMDAYLQLDCYPEVPETLRVLKQLGFRTAILSNGSPTMLAAAINHAGIQPFIDDTLSVEAVGIYKPSPRVYHLAVERLALTAQEISFQSANAWDVAGAANFGLRTVWINRFGQHAERWGCAPDAELTSLAELPALLGGETALLRS